MRRCTRIATVAVVLVGAAVARADIFGEGMNQFNLAFVTISGDTGDLGSWPAGTGYTFTGVNREDYRMGRFEVTYDQWTKFTSSLGVPVTGTPVSAYNSSMAPHLVTTNDPVTEVSWYEAAQFVNWLNTSKGYQAAYRFTGTQGTGDYTFDVWGETEAAGGTNLYRHKDAFYYLPTEDEWMNAAYWNGTNLQTYATKPSEVMHQGDGMTETGWNYFDDGYATDPLGSWDIGSGSEELNGTFDMMGNVSEWTESPYGDPSYGTASHRSQRGGMFSNLVTGLASSSRPYYFCSPNNEHGSVGFRVAANVIPEPSTLGLLSLGGLMVMRRRR